MNKAGASIKQYAGLLSRDHKDVFALETALTEKVKHIPHIIHLGHTNGKASYHHAPTPSVHLAAMTNTLSAAGLCFLLT